MQKLKPGDRVRIRNGERIFLVVEVDVPGCLVFPPSTYAVRLGVPPEGKPDHFLYGDGVLERAP